MYIAMKSPVEDISLPQALSITLDNYYDLLKAQVGSLQAGEYLQLKLVADLLDLSVDKKASLGGYIYFSYLNLLERADVGITPAPVSGGVEVGLERLSAIYGDFVRELRRFVVMKELTAQEQLALADLDKAIEALQIEEDELYIKDRARWERVAPAMGFSIGDATAYTQWSNKHGSLQLIEEKNRDITTKRFKKRTILSRQWPDADDRAVIEAEDEYENVLARLRYPNFPDNLYPDGDLFNPVYLARLGTGSTALFSDRYSAKFGAALDTIKTVGSGTLVGEFNKMTSTSSSITTDWGGSASGSYGLISAHASASEHKQIQEDFSKSTGIKLSAKSATRIPVSFPAWFNPVLFTHRHVLANPGTFERFFGLKGSLLYYPTALIVVRGFSAEFVSSAKWTYDYVKNFSASAGGGFGAFGFSFGGSASYSSTVKEHQVDESSTTLKFSDDEATVRFVGYAVKKNDVLAKPIAARIGRFAFELP